MESIAEWPFSDVMVRSVGFGPSFLKNYHPQSMILSLTENWLFIKTRDEIIDRDLYRHPILLEIDFVRWLTLLPLIAHINQLSYSLWLLCQSWDSRKKIRVSERPSFYLIGPNIICKHDIITIVISLEWQFVCPNPLIFTVIFLYLLWGRERCHVRWKVFVQEFLQVVIFIFISWRVFNPV